LAQDAADMPTGVAPDPTLIERSAPPAADTSYRTADRGGIIAGTVLEGLGLAGMVGGYLTLALSDSEGEPGMAVMVAAGSTFTLGGFVSTAAHTSRHLAYKRAGIPPRGNMAAFSWLFTAGTTALWAVSIHYYATPAKKVTDGDVQIRIDYDLDALIVMGFSMACEILNLSVFRFIWRRDMRLAEEKRDFAVALSPLLIPSRAGSSGSTAAGLAVVGSF
jgi:hypothetical protein